MHHCDGIEVIFTGYGCLRRIIKLTNPLHSYVTACAWIKADKHLVSSYSNRVIVATMYNFTQAISHFLTDAESQYTTIELEMLAVCLAVTKCKVFLAGLQQFSVITLIIIH